MFLIVIVNFTQVLKNAILTKLLFDDGIASYRDALFVNFSKSTFVN